MTNKQKLEEEKSHHIKLIEEENSLKLQLERIQEDLHRSACRLSILTKNDE